MNADSMAHIHALPRNKIDQFVSLERNSFLTYRMIIRLDLVVCGTDALIDTIHAIQQLTSLLQVNPAAQNIRKEKLRVGKRDKNKGMCLRMLSNGDSVLEGKQER